MNSFFDITEKGVILALSLTFPEICVVAFLVVCVIVLCLARGKNNPDE